LHHKEILTEPNADLFIHNSPKADGHLQHFLPGIGKLLLTVPVSVVPLYIEGTFEALPRGRHVPASIRSSCCSARRSTRLSLTESTGTRLDIRKSRTDFTRSWPISGAGSNPSSEISAASFP
jgi:hypothetical protein